MQEGECSGILRFVMFAS